MYSHWNVKVLFANNKCNGCNFSRQSWWTWLKVSVISCHTSMHWIIWDMWVSWHFGSETFLSTTLTSKVMYQVKCWQINLFCFQKLNSPTVSVTSESFVPMLARLDECISFISSNVSSYFSKSSLSASRAQLNTFNNVKLTEVLSLGLNKTFKIREEPNTHSPSPSHHTQPFCWIIASIAPGHITKNYHLMYTLFT